MTICTYYQGALYADRAGLMLSSPTYPVLMKKLFVSKCGRIAVGVAGKREDSDFTDSDKMQAIVDMVTNDKDSNKAIEISEDFTKMIADRHLLIMSKDAVYKYHKGKVNRIDLDSMASIGTGSNSLTIALLSGKPIEQALHIAALSDSCSFVTEIDKVKMSDLK